jgi:hypothetical protein
LEPELSRIVFEFRETLRDGDAASVSASSG